MAAFIGRFGFRLFQKPAFMIMSGFSGVAFFVAVFGGRCYVIFMAAAFMAGHSNCFYANSFLIFKQPSDF
jgi:hypothetical protein